MIIINENYVCVQVKDIKMMIYSEKSHLISLHAKLMRRLRNGYKMLDDYYIKISNSDLSFNQLLLENWLINRDDIENKSIEELNVECENINIQINLLNEKIKKRDCRSICNYEYKIILLKYKLFCIEEILNERNENNEHSKKVRKF